jgi:hypothetical protein
VACFRPLSAWQTAGGSIVFVERGDILRALQLPCNSCLGCLLERSRKWAIRCLHESQMHEDNCFVTLTYDDAHLGDGSLNYRDYQLFMRRLRKRFGAVRFFMCGEYGDLRGRPHFHSCLFGFNFPDREYYRTLRSGSRLYTSGILSDLWPKGFSSIGDVTFESAAYVARYIFKKFEKPIPGWIVSEGGECRPKVREFTRMSLKPGIGREWIEKYLDEVYDNDYVVVNGVKCRPPKYYDGVLKLVRPDSFESLEVGRVANAVLHAPDCTPARLADREVVTRARLAFKRRDLE